MTWSIWLLMPNNVGYSRVAGNLSREDAEKFAAAMLFPARAMPDEVL